MREQEMKGFFREIVSLQCGMQNFSGKKFDFRGFLLSNRFFLKKRKFLLERLKFWWKDFFSAASSCNTLSIICEQQFFCEPILQKETSFFTKLVPNKSPQAKNEKCKCQIYALPRNEGGGEEEEGRWSLSKLQSPQKGNTYF